MDVAPGAPRYRIATLGGNLGLRSDRTHETGHNEPAVHGKLRRAARLTNAEADKGAIESFAATPQNSYVFPLQLS